MSLKLIKSVKSDLWSTGLKRLPNKIPRKNTDILHALSATVTHDPTSIQYKFADDPFLIPTTISEKRVYALAQEAGRKAAKWVHQEHADLFQHKNAQPPIAAFIPTVNETADEQTIRKHIDNQNYSAALSLFKTLTSETKEISAEVKREMLEIVCFCNGEEMTPIDCIEERWFQQVTNEGANRFRNTWDVGGLAERLFSESDPKDAHLYNALIRGKCKYFDTETAYQLYSDAMDKKLSIDVNTHNAIIRIIGHLKDNNVLKWENTLGILQTMAKDNVKPNLGTLNAVLYLISTIGNIKQAKQFILQTLSEFNAIGIEPSLESWDIVLHVFCKQRGPISYCLSEIMDILEQKDHIIAYDKNDTKFFLTAMNVCRSHLNDVQLARRVYRLVQRHQKVNLLGDSRYELFFYRHYMGVLLANEMPDVFLETYTRLVPSIYIPEINTMLDILEYIKQHSAMHLLPAIWTDIVQFDYVHRKAIAKNVVKLMLDSYDTHPDLRQTLSLVLTELWTSLQLELAKSTEPEYDGELFGDILHLFGQHGDFSGAVGAFQLIKEHAHELQGSVNMLGIEKYLMLCLDNEQPGKVTECLHCCARNLFEDGVSLDKVLGGFKTLSEGQIERLKSLSQAVLKD